jgi:hypothetical protein
MRKAGNRIVRVWVDPVLDEPALRAMDAAIWIAAQNGITLDVCVFNQWVRDLGFERTNGEHVSFEFRNPADFNLYSFSLRNLDLQREYMRTLAHRWKQIGNVIYNLANETYIKDPDVSQMDSETTAWSEAQQPSGTLRDTLLFRRWADEMTKVIRTEGGKQIVFPGYLFSLSQGGDTYLANAHAPLVPWHGYFSPEWIGQTIHYHDPLCSGRPLLLEEFGSLGWNHADHYDAAMHYALAAGAGAAMSYEWGVSWLSPEAPFVPLPLRDALVDKPDPRWFAPLIDYARKNTTETGTGIAPWPSGFGYGSIYHGTPFPAEAARAVWRLAQFGTRFARAIHTPEEVYVIVPEATPATIETSLPLFKELWLRGIRFGVWQSSQLQKFPSSAKMILLAGILSSTEKETIRKQADPTAQIYPLGDLSWKERTNLPGTRFSPQGNINCLIRSTQTGKLYTFASDQKKETVTAEIDDSTLTAGLHGFLLIHTSQQGVDFIEAADTVQIDRTTLFTTSEGRLMVGSQDGQPLTSFGDWRIIATEPTEVRFACPVASASVLVPSPNGTNPVKIPLAENQTLIIDQELIRYVIEITFAKP